jgi:uncharacterized protein YbcI
MGETHASSPTSLMAVSNAMIKLHKEQFGRGPTTARSNFAGPDTLVCVLENVLLPAERKLVDLGEQARVREGRISFQAATASEFVAAVEQIVYRKVRAFASGVDPDADVVFETFYFESREPGIDGHGTMPESAGDAGRDGHGPT